MPWQEIHEAAPSAGLGAFLVPGRAGQHPQRFPSVCWSEPGAAHAAYTALMAAHWHLAAQLPRAQLAPGLSQRCNYVAWVRELCACIAPAAAGEAAPQVSRALAQPWAADIGTGASGVLLLLAACMLGWRGLGTDICASSLELLQATLDRNLEELQRRTGHQRPAWLQLLPVTADAGASVPVIAAEAEAQAGGLPACAVLANPPFFESDAEGSSNPRTCHAGRSNEVATAGGEVEWVRALIHASSRRPEAALWWTTMLGRKRSVLPLASECIGRGAVVLSTTFYQGRTLRWGLAWTWLPAACLASSVLEWTGHARLPAKLRVGICEQQWAMLHGPQHAARLGRHSLHVERQAGPSSQPLVSFAAKFDLPARPACPGLAWQRVLHALGMQAWAASHAGHLCWRVAPAATGWAGAPGWTLQPLLHLPAGMAISRPPDTAGSAEWRAASGSHLGCIWLRAAQRESPAGLPCVLRVVGLPGKRSRPPQVKVSLETGVYGPAADTAQAFMQQLRVLADASPA